MKLSFLDQKIVVILRFLTGVVITLTAVSAAQGQEAQYPLVKKFGGIYPVEEATKLPDTSLTYQIVVDVTAEASEPGQINPSLNNIARLLNLHALGGVPPDQLEVVAVVHSDATPFVLAPAAFQQEMGYQNPDLAILQDLREAGVHFYVCGQTLRARGYEGLPLNPAVDVSISALTALTEYQLRGYALISL